MLPQCGSFIDEVYVLLVHSDKDVLNSMGTLLQSCSYRVIGVELAYEAMSIISRKKHKVDIILTDVHLPDLDVFELLHLAVNEDVPTVLMSTKDDFDMMLPKKAIENGALEFLMNPITTETLRYLQQYAVRDKLEKTKSAKNFIQWTDELHAKFLDAINQLGDGRCYPARIHELVNVAGLTTRQVASHLQKFRDGTWRNARKSPRPRTNPEKFGRIPLSAANSSSEPKQTDLQENVDDNHNNNIYYTDQTEENVEQTFVSQPFMPHSSMHGSTSLNNSPNIDRTRNGIPTRGYSSKQKLPADGLQNTQDFSGLPPLNENPRRQLNVFDYERLLQEEHYMDTNNMTRGQWSAGTSRFRGPQS